MSQQPEGVRLRCDPAAVAEIRHESTQKECSMPHIIVQAHTPVGRTGAPTFAERSAHITPNQQNDHYIAHLIERVGRPLIDAEQLEAQANNSERTGRRALGPGSWMKRGRVARAEGDASRRRLPHTSSVVGPGQRTARDGCQRRPRLARVLSPRSPRSIRSRSATYFRKRSYLQANRAGIMKPTNTSSGREQLAASGFTLPTPTPIAPRVAAAVRAGRPPRRCMPAPHPRRSDSPPRRRRTASHRSIQRRSTPPPRAGSHRSNARRPAPSNACAHSPFSRTLISRPESRCEMVVSISLSETAFRQL